MQPLNVMNAPKTSTFQMRINPEIKAQVEQIYERSGLTLTDAINCLPAAIHQCGRSSVCRHAEFPGGAPKCSHCAVDDGDSQGP